MKSRSPSVAWGAILFSRNSSESNGCWSNSVQNPSCEAFSSAATFSGSTPFSVRIVRAFWLSCSSTRTICWSRSFCALICRSRPGLAPVSFRSFSHLRSFESARSIVLPEVTNAPESPSGTTAWTFGTLSSDASSCE